MWAYGKLKKNYCIQQQTTSVRRSKKRSDIIYKYSLSVRIFEKSTQ